MCLYTSAYLHITVVLLPSFETEFICSNRGIWLQVHCIQTRGGVSFSLQWFPKRHQKKWLQDIYSCHLCTQFTITLTEVYRCQLSPPLHTLDTRTALNRWCSICTQCTSTIIWYRYITSLLLNFTQHNLPPHSRYNTVYLLSIISISCRFIRESKEGRFLRLVYFSFGGWEKP